MRFAAAYIRASRRWLKCRWLAARDTQSGRPRTYDAVEAPKHPMSWRYRSPKRRPLLGRGCPDGSRPSALAAFLSDDEVKASLVHCAFGEPNGARFPAVADLGLNS